MVILIIEDDHHQNLEAEILAARMELAEKSIACRMAMEAVAIAFRDIAHAVVLRDEPENVPHAIRMIAEELEAIKCEPINWRNENQLDRDQKNNYHGRRNILATGRNGYPVKNARSIRTWTPRKYITRKAVSVMRQRKNG
jgi:hypothetical protein